ncbi:MAG TPA: zf-HC2 domain-containing protein [Myxococcaceae bacterium]|nr:zf-HC2 domain-containing protein [Myxococcaceae bacterium]
MFTCKDSIHSLLEYVDGELSEEDVQKLREHLHGCTPCVDFLNTYRATPKLARRALVDQMPDEMADKLKAFLRSKCQAK